MRTIKTPSILLLLVASVSLAFAAGPEDAASPKIPYEGLTGTIVELLRVREVPTILLGSNGYRIEDFIDDDIDELYSCDAALSEYLGSDEPCNYERLSAIIEDAILAALDDKSAAAFAIVEASEDGNTISLSIALEYSKNILLPIYLETIEGEVKASCAIPSALRFSVAMSLVVDSDTVLNESVLSGTSIGIDSLTMSVKPTESDWKAEASLLYQDELAALTLAESKVDIDLYWNLCDAEGGYLEDRKLSYEELGRGEYRWVQDTIGEIALSGTIATGADEDAGVIEFSYASSDLREQIPYSIRLVEDGLGRDLAIRRLAF